LGFRYHDYRNFLLHDCKFPCLPSFNDEYFTTQIPATNLNNPQNRGPYCSHVFVLGRKSAQNIRSNSISTSCAWLCKSYFSARLCT
jgi:hypothetical protein